MTREVGIPLVHSGPAPAERIVSVASAVEVVRGELPPGAVLIDALWNLMEPTGALAGSAELGPGTFGHLPYVYPAIGEDGYRPMSFTTANRSPGPSLCLGGSATVGRRHGQRFTHTHASWMDGQGCIRGGHLLPEARVGEVPILVVLRALVDAEQISDDDPETGLPTFTPFPRPTDLGRRSRPTGRAVISRVRPGVFIDDAVRQICRGAGFDRAQVRASLGSTVGARLTTAEGVKEVAWPAVEYTQLVGSGQGMLGSESLLELQGTLVDIHGDIHHGVVRPGENPVAVTFELYIEEVTP